MEVIPVAGIGEIEAGAHVATVITDAVDLQADDVVVVTSKIVSKAEGRVIDYTDSRREALIRSESTRVLRQRGTLFITETKHGFIAANAGIDWSNVTKGKAVLLPNDPDRSAHRIRNGIRGINGLDVAVIISDTFGRAWRNGVTDVAIGCAGITPIDDHRGRLDRYGNELKSTQICTVDQLASAAALVMPKAAGIPVAIIRGLNASGSGSVAQDVVRKPNYDLFR